jgi:NAD(P)-dependent dehydrogenase (short-subunit alcohol dehydrogenase family)
MNTMVGKVALVTGASSGLGLATARALAASGAELILWCRDAVRAEAARAAIVRETGNPHVHVVLADLASQVDVRRGAADVLERFPRLDVLVNNAGVVLAERRETPDGIEAMLATNHLAPFLLTHLLRERLVRSAQRAAPARVITVSSSTLWLGKIRFDDLQSTRHYNGYALYATTKLMNVLFTRELARQLAGSGVVASAMHPGTVRTNISPPDGTFVRWLGSLARPLMLTPDQGADTIVWLARDAAGERANGGYYVRRKVGLLPPAARNAALARRLWEASRRLTGLG